MVGGCLGVGLFECDDLMATQINFIVCRFGMLLASIILSSSV